MWRDYAATQCATDSGQHRHRQIPNNWPAPCRGGPGGSRISRRTAARSDGQVTGRPPFPRAPPPGGVAATRGEDRKPPSQAFQQGGGAERAQPRGRKLERERQSVEPAADLERRGVGHEIGPHGARAFGEQDECVGVRKRFDRIFALAIDAQGSATGRKHLRARPGAQDLPDGGCGIEQVLEVVEHQQRSAIAEFAEIAHADRRCDRRSDERRRGRPRRCAPRGARRCRYSPRPSAPVRRCARPSAPGSGHRANLAPPPRQRARPKRARTRRRTHRPPCRPRLLHVPRMPCAGRRGVRPVRRHTRRRARAKPRRTLDVGEQEGHCAGRKPAPSGTSVVRRVPAEPAGRHTLRRRRGSRASRSASPRKLKANTATKMASPGPTLIHHLRLER